MMRLIKKLGYKTVTEFYQDIANETRDANDIIEKYLELKKKETENREDIVYRSAENFSMQTAYRKGALGWEKPRQTIPHHAAHRWP